MEELAKLKTYSELLLENVRLKRELAECQAERDKYKSYYIYSGYDSPGPLSHWDE